MPQVGEMSTAHPSTNWERERLRAEAAEALCERLQSKLRYVDWSVEWYKGETERLQDILSNCHFCTAETVEAIARERDELKAELEQLRTKTDAMTEMIAQEWSHYSHHSNLCENVDVFTKIQYARLGISCPSCGSHWLVPYKSKMGYSGTHYLEPGDEWSHYLCCKCGTIGVCERFGFEERENEDAQ